MSQAGAEKRFAVAPTVRRMDVLARRVIFLGGVGVLLAVSGLFLFLGIEVLPLFQGAKTSSPITISSTIEDPLLIGASTDGTSGFVLSQNGFIQPLELKKNGTPQQWNTLLAPSSNVQSAEWFQDTQTLLIGTTDGILHKGHISFDTTLNPSMLLSIQWDAPVQLGESPLIQLDKWQTRTRNTVAAISENEGQATVYILVEEQVPLPFAESAKKSREHFEIQLDKTISPRKVLIGPFGESMLILTQVGSVLIYEYKSNQWTPTFNSELFVDPEKRIVSIYPIQGRKSFYLTDAKGGHHIATLQNPPNTPDSRWSLQIIRTFPNEGTPLRAFAASTSNKAVLVATDDALLLRYATTGKTRWRQPVEYPSVSVLLGSRYEQMLLLQENGYIVSLQLEDPHPESGWKSAFAKIRYEGHAAPEFMWQSTGGADSYETKLSLVPLLFGSFKGTLFALLFSIPIALTAAIYTSQFLHPRLRGWVKPTVELMASFPSVVLGFIAALWLAPALENHIPSFFLLCLSVPLSALVGAWLWKRLPQSVQRRVPDGFEFILLIPLLLALAVGAWFAGPILEAIFCRIKDPVTGQSMADFRLWYEQITSGHFQQRNALVIGIVMGFAISPVIYTLAEDALSSVPRSLVSGSLALGANRWQTTFNIILPTASAGIFSAIMLGMGRAIGETMILLMATGNTPIMNGDIFSGMRTLAANIAIELPEAPADSTLYRTLFLGAMVLFVLTFILNTFAELLREKLRRRYRIIE
jgi:phosphate transport system permease protein